MGHNSAAPQRLHGVAKNVPANRLNNILAKFRPIAFQSFPFFRAADAHVRNRIAAELIGADAFCASAIERSSSGRLQSFSSVLLNASSASQ